MVDIKNICIIGAGNIGMTAAIDISQKTTYKVTLLSSRANELNIPFKKIDSDTGIETIGKNIIVTNDYKSAMDDCDLAIITIPSFLIYEIIQKLPTNKLKMIIDLGHDVTVGPMQLFMHETFNTNFTTCFFSCNIN